jgi:enoyl-CoA hydratase
MNGGEILVCAEGAVGRVQLNRPTVLNALNSQLMAELVRAMEAFQADPEIRCILLHGDEKAFAAGADLKEFADTTAIGIYLKDFTDLWDAVYRIRKPVVAAVSGWALGGGCELAMICDIIVASETARFGLPEINVAAIPGAGGTQRLTMAVGKSLAMEMILAGRRLTAQEALAAGLVSRVAPVEMYLEEAMKVAQQIAAKSPVALQMAKEAVLQSFEPALSNGTRLERHLMHLSFASEDRKEGQRAFFEKRPPLFKGR